MATTTEKITIYILKLERGKWYVGKTKNLEQRIKSHSSSFTLKYKPIKVHEVIENCDDFDEEKYTLIYMQKYGINNVRGGPYTSIVLQPETIAHIEKSLTASSDSCFKCSEKGHFAKDCCSDSCDSEEDEIICFACCVKGHLSTECYKKQKITCFTCGVKGHLSTECYSQRNIICCFVCGKKGHLSTECFYR